MHANLKASEGERLPDDQVLAQITQVFSVLSMPNSCAYNEPRTFTFAAMDTTSSALCRIFWLLATYQDVQDKLRAEIREVKKDLDGEEPDYDRLSAMPYLDAVTRETLRL